MYLAVDLGSTSFKAGVFDAGLRLRGEGTAPVEYVFGYGGRVEFGVDAAEDRLRSAIRDGLCAASVRADALEAVAITSQAQTFTITDKRGRAKMPFISWQDARPTAKVMDDLNHRLPSFPEHSGVGTCLPILLESKLLDLQRRSVGGFVRADDHVLHLPTYFTLRMSGAAAIDENVAAMCGLYSLRLRYWWPEALDVCRIGTTNLPRLLPLGSVAGRTSGDALAYGLCEGIPIVLAGNDQTAGAWGAGLEETRALLITLGTAQVAYICVDSLPPACPGTMRGPFGGELSYRLAADECGGSTVNWARTQIPGCDDDAAFNLAAAGAPAGCDGLAFVADGPVGTGRWTGARPEHGPGHYARAVLEWLAVRMKGMIETLETNPSAAPVLVGGGGSRSETWLRILREILGADLQTTNASPLLGAARMAACALPPAQRKDAS